MSRIEFEQISENEIEVVIPPETPMEMVQTLIKSFLSKGLVEDLQKSTLGVRRFYRPQDGANQLADKLIKSLEGMSKTSDLPYWHPKAQMANQQRVRENEIAARRGLNGVKPPANVSPAQEPHLTPDRPTTPTAPKSFGSMNTAHPKMYDNTPAAQQTADGSGKRYAYINDPIKKEEHDEDCECGKCETVEKSNYGPKGGGQYSAANNAKRKMNNTGDQTGFGSNVNTKAYSSKPGQLSAKQQASVTSKIQARANKKQPVKYLSPEEIEAQYGQKPMKKSWGQHLPFPSAEEEIMKFAESELDRGESAAANQLASLMAGKNMLGTTPPPQPTDQEMFGHLVPSEEMVKNADRQWKNKFADFFAEAQKPISQRFASEEEELAYWRNIKVADRDDGQSGY